MVAAVAGVFLAVTAASHAIQATADTLRGVTSCADSKRFSVPQHCWRGWLWRQRRQRKSSSNWGFNPSVPTATTTMRHTLARPTVFTGLGISTTASSLAWAHGLAGDMATAGAGIVSVTVVEETIAAAVAPWPIAATMQEAEELRCALVAAASVWVRRAELMPLRHV